MGESESIEPMKATFCVILLMTSLVAGTSALGGLGLQKPATAQNCKVLCQRFGMEALKKMFDGKDFGSTPQECCVHCDEVFSGGGSKTPPEKEPAISGVVQ